MEVSGQLLAPVALLAVEKAPGADWFGGWVGPRAGLDALKKRKIPCPFREANPARIPSLYRLSYHSLTLLYNKIINSAWALRLLSPLLPRSITLWRFSDALLRQAAVLRGWRTIPIPSKHWRTNDCAAFAWSKSAAVLQKYAFATGRHKKKHGYTSLTWMGTVAVKESR
jgi:hypothetical protein